MQIQYCGFQSESNMRCSGTKASAAYAELAANE